MTTALSRLSNSDLGELLTSLKNGRMSPPFSGLQVSRVLGAESVQPVEDALNQFVELGFTVAQIVLLMEVLLADRRSTQTTKPTIDLVTSGPEADGVTNRDTAVVVRELFTHAQHSVLVVGYAVYQGRKVFEKLAERMEENPDLAVEFYLDAQRQQGDTSSPEILLSRFVQNFKNRQWPNGCRLPTVYYDPRSLAERNGVRSSLHAKCIVVDKRYVFVSSANFTEAAQQRNIEVGVQIDSPWLAERLTRHFQLLNTNNIVKRAF